MPGLTFSNEMISRDEGLHTIFSTHVYELLVNKLDQDEVNEIVKSAVSIEKEDRKSTRLNSSHRL